MSKNVGAYGGGLFSLTTEGYIKLLEETGFESVQPYTQILTYQGFIAKIILLGNINKGLKPNILNVEENIKNGKLKSCFCCTREGGSKNMRERLSCERKANFQGSILDRYITKGCRDF